MKNYGFVFKPSEEGEWHVGQGVASQKFGAVDYMPNGHGWGKYLPKAERQNNGLETQACTVYGSLNALETLANFKGYKDFPQNCSERFSAIMADVTPNGNDPQKSCEAIRRWGVIPESVLPFDETIKSWPNYYHPDPMEEAFIKLGQDILKKYQIGHEYVFNGATGVTPKADRLIAALSRGTVCVSVHAWKERNGLYYKDPSDSDNHWVHLVDYKMGDYWLVRDTYAPFDKKIEWDTNFQSAKLYFLNVNTSGVTPNTLDYWVYQLKEAIKKLFSVKTMPSTDNLTEIPLEPPVVPVAKSNREKLYDTAKACIGRNMRSGAAPQEFGCVDAFRGVFKETFGYDVAPGVLNTNGLNAALAKDKHFKAVLDKELMPGDIRIALTEGDVHGHVFVRGNQDSMSNDSSSGLWKANYHNQNVDLVFKGTLGLKINNYRCV